MNGSAASLSIRTALPAASGCFSGRAASSGSVNNGWTVSPSSASGVAITPRSRAPDRSWCKSSAVVASRTSSRPRGQPARNRTTAGGSRYGPTVGMAATLSRPASGSAVTLATASSARANSWSTRSRNSAPASVSATPPAARANSGLPSSASSLAICWLRVGCVTPQAAAALVNPPSRAAAAKYRSWGRSTPAS
jgi:hypothetical protein